LRAICIKSAIWSWRAYESGGFPRTLPSAAFAKENIGESGGQRFFHYNFFPQHQILRTSPAQAAGVTDELLDMTHLCKLMDNANPTKKRRTYKKASVVPESA
jgi:hypothetical protein